MISVFLHLMMSWRNRTMLLAIIFYLLFRISNAEGKCSQWNKMYENNWSIILNIVNDHDDCNEIYYKPFSTSCLVDVYIRENLFHWSNIHTRRFAFFRSDVECFYEANSSGKTSNFNLFLENLNIKSYNGSERVRGNVNLFAMDHQAAVLMIISTK